MKSMKPPQNMTYSYGVLRPSRLVNTCRCWEGIMPTVGMEAPHAFPHTLTYAPLLSG